MPKFVYTTLDSNGKEISDVVEAYDVSVAAGIIRGQGKVITSLKEVEVSKNSEGSPSSSILDCLSFITSSDIVMMFRQFSILIKAGVTLTNSLQILCVQARKTKLKKLLDQVLTGVEEGSTFADALRKHKRIFTPFIVNMIECGEVAGTMDIVLESIADYLEEKSEFRTQVITSFIYPAIVVVMCIIVVTFLAGFVIPKFMPFISARGRQVPWNTQFLLNATNWFKNHWKSITAAVAAVFTGLFILGKFKTPGYWIDRLKVRIPVIGPIFIYSVVVRFAKNLSSLLSSGVSMLESLRTVRNVIGNQAAMDVMETMERKVARGENLSSSIREGSFIFPPIVAEMVAVGEETGNLDETLSFVAQIHEKLLKTYVKRMNSLIEPVLILMMGGIVGFVAWGLIAGVLSMYGTY